MVSIIIPVHDQIQKTGMCIDAVRANTQDYEIIIVDNGSNPSCPKYCDILIRNETNLGFPVAVNQGIRAATGDTIVILNNDCIVTPNWLEILLSRLSDGLDMVGPVTNSISGPQQVLIDIYDDIPALNIAAETHRKKNAGQWYPFHRIVFFCVAIKREVIDKIGLLDEAYTPGNYEDDDYCMRAIDAGFKLGVARDCYVHHVGSVTHKALGLDYQELAARNRKIFDAKWGVKYDTLMEANNET